MVNEDHEDPANTGASVIGSQTIRNMNVLPGVDRAKLHTIQIVQQHDITGHIGSLDFVCQSNPRTPVRTIA